MGHAGSEPDSNTRYKLVRKLGKIVRLQVQRESIKSGSKPNERYTPESHLLSVQSLRLDADGVQGVAADGSTIPDVHNRSHPRSKYRGNNGISLIFTGHYAAIRGRFGDHMVDGIAAESILVDCDEILPLESIQRGIVIVGDDREINIGPWEVAHPCAPFSKYCLQFPEDAKPDRRITETLKFLDDGMRGFLAVFPDEAEPVEIRLGDVVFAVD